MAEASPEQLVALEEFGNEIGIAYQLVDDLLDLLGDDQIGKPRDTQVDVHEEQDDFASDTLIDIVSWQGPRKVGRNN